jgi:hypothetical protein
MMWAKLTSSFDGAPIWVNLARAAAYHLSGPSSGQYTNVVMERGVYYEVKETPEQIEQVLASCGYPPTRTPMEAADHEATKPVHLPMDTHRPGEHVAGAMFI